MNKLCIFTIFIATVYLTQVESACNACNKYGFACVSKTHYRICDSDGKMVDAGKPSLPCGQGQFCADQPTMCLYKTDSNASPACSANNFCGVCEPGKIFTCTTSKSFARCHEGEIDERSTGICPGTTVCDTRTSFVCVEADIVDKLKCDATPATTPEPPTTTPEPTTTSTSTSTETSTSTSTETSTSTTTEPPTTSTPNTTSTTTPIALPTENPSIYSRTAEIAHIIAYKIHVMYALIRQYVRSLFL